MERIARMRSSSPGTPKAHREYLGSLSRRRIYFEKSAAVYSIDSLCLITIRLTDETGILDSTSGNMASSE